MDLRRRPGRIRILGIPISATSYEQILQIIGEPAGSTARTVAFCNVHSVMVARRHPSLMASIESFDIATTDGMPLVWALRRLGVPDQERVYGPDLMQYALQQSVGRGWRHYFYGAAPDVLERLVVNVRQMAPGLEVVGSCSPPYRELRPDEEEAHLSAIRASGATHLWVGLGMPKQELFLARVADRLPGMTLLAVGAAFDMHAGVVAQAPDWVQDRGLEWAYRWAQEPRRLASRYLVNNPMFVILMMRHLVVRRIGAIKR